MTTILLAGGGTAGHVNPLLATAEELRQRHPGAKLIALGTREGLEARLVPERGFELQTIARLPFPRTISPYLLKFPFKYWRAYRRVRALLRKRKVAVVVGFGGYVCPPAYQAARSLGIPVVVHEANARPGFANKFGAKFARHIAVTFENTPIERAQVTGMPLREEVARLDRAARRAEACEFFGLDPALPTLLVTGGSLGARAINEGISAAAKAITSSGAQVLHIWGGLTDLQDPQVPGFHLLRYCDRMELAFAACDLAVSRAGATAVSELTGLNIPAVFVPYRTGNGEQALNCATAVRAGGALMVEDEQLTPDWITSTLIPLLHDRARLRSMSAALAPLSPLDGASRLSDLIDSCL